MLYRFLLLIFGLVSSYIGYPDDVLITFSFYFSLLFSSLFLINFNRKIKIVMYLIFVIFASFIKELIPFLPLIAYDVYIGFDTSYILFLTLIPITVNYDKETIVYTLLFITISILLKDRNIKYEMLEKDYFNFQDNVEYERDTLVKKLHNTNELIDENAELAVLKERARIARDIHDNLGHSLTRSLYQIKMHEMKSGIDLSDLKDNINNSMIEVRNSVHNLQNTTLNLKEEIEKMASNKHNLKVTYNYNVDDEIKPKLKLAIIYTIKECLVNTTKHSNADKFDIQIFEISDELNILIKDNGSNYKPIKPGIGLINIENRINELGGKVRFSTDNGFRVFMKIKRWKND